jgi:PAS domain S-box-containing protein
VIDKIGAEELTVEDERLAGMLTAQVGRTYVNGSLYADVLRHAADLEREVAERQRAEAERNELQLRLHHVVASSPAVLFTLAVSGKEYRLNWMSDNVREMMGYSLEEVFQPTWWHEGIHPEDYRQVQANIESDLFASGQLADEYRFRHRNGKYRWVRSELRLLRDTAGIPIEIVGSWSDVTERRLLEEQFRQAQKMEAVGLLAGGVAHDFNNLLTIINGYSDLVQTQLPAESPMRELVREIGQAGERAASLTRQLLAFSRKQVLEPKVLNLNAIVTDMGKMLRRLLGEDIDLVNVLEPGVGRVKADPGQIEQILVNVGVNARDAMPRGGKLTVETTNAHLDETYTAAHPDLRPGPYVLLALSDTGCGMDEAIKARIFEPFFTTKGPGKGTGLGLATVYGIVKQCGGHIAVYSEPEHGTTFKVYLPMVAETGSSIRFSPDLPSTRGGSETILVAEDEPALRGLTRHVLEMNGYTVLDGGHGERALRIAQEHSGPIHLLVTDVVMPVLDGRELVDACSSCGPGSRSCTCRATPTMPWSATASCRQALPSCRSRSRQAR